MYRVSDFQQMLCFVNFVSMFMGKAKESSGLYVTAALSNRAPGLCVCALLRTCEGRERAVER